MDVAGIGDMLQDEKAGIFMSTFGTPPATNLGTTVQDLIKKHGVKTLDWTNSNPDAKNFPDALKDNLAHMAAAGDPDAQQLMEALS